MMDYSITKQPVSDICITRGMEFIPVSVDEAVDFVFKD